MLSPSGCHLRITSTINYQVGMSYWASVVCGVFPLTVLRRLAYRSVKGSSISNKSQSPLPSLHVFIRDSMQIAYTTRKRISETAAEKTAETKPSSQIIETCTNWELHNWDTCNKVCGSFLRAVFTSFRCHAASILYKLLLVHGERTTRGSLYLSKNDAKHYLPSNLIRQFSK